MDFEKQKPISDEYRDGYERIYHPNPLQVKEFWAGSPLYPNGCPIIPEGPQKDDL